MKQMINFTFVLHYYDNVYDFINRIIHFVEGYFDEILDENYIIHPDRIMENGGRIIEFGEIIPFFLKYLDIHLFNYSDYENKEDMIRNIVDVILDQKEYLEENHLNTLVIRLTHIVYE